MSSEARPKSAFTCHRGLFQFNVMPFGLCNAPGTFQALMNKVLQGINGTYAIAYLDDIIIWSSSAEKHLEHMREVFTGLEQAGLKVKTSKCKLFTGQVNYLGHVISPEGISPDPEKVAAISQMPVPETVQEVRILVGMAGFYRKFVEHFSDIVKPLTSVTRKGMRFTWGPDQQTAFETVKKELTEAPVLTHVNMMLPFNLYTDASGYAVGAVLMQVLPEGEKVIQYLSRQLSPTQVRWSTIEKEAYAIIFAINKLRPYLWGSPITVFTDHKPLSSLFTSEMKNMRVQRWAVIMSEYDITFKYKTGATNKVADALSRLRPTDTDVYEDAPPSASVNIIDSQTPPLAGDDKGPESSEIPPIPLDITSDALKVHQAQAFSPTIANIADSKEFVMEDGLLYRIAPPAQSAICPSLQLCIPQGQVPNLLQKLHCSEFEGGHLGITRTYNKVRSRFYWPGMYRDIASFVTKCEICLTRRKKVYRAPMQDMPIANYPIDIIGIDTCGPFPMTPNGNKYIDQQLLIISQVTQRHTPSPTSRLKL